MNSIDLRLGNYAKEAYRRHTVRLKHNTEVLLESDGTTGIIALRGSEKHWKDWAANFMAIPVACRSIGIAPWGFARRALRTFDYLTKGDGTEFMRNHDYFQVTGHSQGGAVGILLGELLYAYGFNVTRCVALGAPKTGKRDLEVPTAIYDHAGDIVCKVPFLWGHPIKPKVLPDVSQGPRQHPADYYLTALRV